VWTQRPGLVMTKHDHLIVLLSEPFRLLNRLAEELGVEFSDALRSVDEVMIALPVYAKTFEQHRCRG